MKREEGNKVAYQDLGWAGNYLNTLNQLEGNKVTYQDLGWCNEKFFVAFRSRILEASSLNVTSKT
jgi:hypothetical protein